MATRLGLHGGPRPALGAGAAIASAVVSGTAVAGLTESQVTIGGETIVITLTNATWVASGATFDAQRQNIIDGITGDLATAQSWNTAVRDTIDVSAVVRTSDTVVTITLPAASGFDIEANETVTVTVPASAHSGSDPITGSPTIEVAADVNVVAIDTHDGGRQVRRRRRREQEDLREELETAIIGRIDIPEEVSQEVAERVVERVVQAEALPVDHTEQIQALTKMAETMLVELVEEMLEDAA